MLTVGLQAIEQHLLLYSQIILVFKNKVKCKNERKMILSQNFE